MWWEVNEGVVEREMGREDTLKIMKGLKGEREDLSGWGGNGH